MSEIVHVYRCPRCLYEIEVTIAEKHDCPACGYRMMYVTSRRKTK